MPKETFLRLSEDKKEKILSAAKKEFSRVTLEEVSIKNIVEDAEIARGSFYQYFEDKEALQKATACWEFIKSRLIDRENGEWYWSIRADDTVNRTDDKAGFWKCPYHNGRMCLEVMERFGDE